MPRWISWLIALVRGVLGIKADIHDKEQQGVGAEKQIVTQQTAIIQEVKKADETDALDARMSDDALKLRLSRFKRPD